MTDFSPGRSWLPGKLWIGAEPADHPDEYRVFSSDGTAMAWAVLEPERRIWEVRTTDDTQLYRVTLERIGVRS